ncbi:auxin-responsive protein IAA9-like isoform X2 [Magnolia sinica]|uniref:auxin-responsive protein IAA9-like isoform X2 n=1 Tax=Magnolia sinica TaxID=86752 RepID=UPI0026592BD4|nr:auxin-responsive protein IAA9-like isoform X2 [Magnolia sinica]
MELELGLAPPNHLIKCFDLNTPTHVWGRCCGFSGTKRGFDEAFDPTCAVIKTLPLFWNDGSHDHGDDGDDDGNDAGACFQMNPSSCPINKIVGWPPIKSSLKLLRGDIKDSYVAPNSLYVKVKMDGMAIGRKVDLSLHDSYQTLTQALERMFGIHEKGKIGDIAHRPNYRITYQDKEGDWMLIRDVSWPTFIRSVQRLKIQKINGD